MDGVSDDDMRTLFNKYDVDGGGAISFDEQVLTPRMLLLPHLRLVLTILLSFRCYAVAAGSSRA